MKMFYNFMLFTICLNASAYLLPLFIALPTYSSLSTVGMPSLNDPLGLADFFTLNSFLSSFTNFLVGAGALGLAALLLRAGTFTYWALLLWAVGTLAIPMVSRFVLAIPNLLNVVLPPMGMSPNPISLMVTGLFAFAGFMFLFELVTQRQIS